MSGIAGLNGILASSAKLTELVPAASILNGPIALSDRARADGALPAISLKVVSSEEHEDVEMGGWRLITDRVQATVYAATYDEKGPILAALRRACVGRSGTFNEVEVESVMPAGGGPDFDDPAASIFERSVDFLVSWHMPPTPEQVELAGGGFIELEGGGTLLTENQQGT